MRRSVIIVALLFLLTSVQAEAAGSVYVFSNDARFVEISLSEGRIVDVGNLWHMDIVNVRDVLPGSKDRAVFLSTKSWKLLGIENPSRYQWEQNGLVELNRAHKGGLVFSRFIAPPQENASLAGGRIFQIEAESRLFLTWRTLDGQGNSRILLSVHKPRGRMLRRVEGFAVWDRSCLEEGALRLHTPVFGQPRDIRTLDLQTWSVSRRPYEHLRGRNAFSMFAPAASPEACLMLVGQRQSKGGDKTFHLYDYVNERVVSSFQSAMDADYRFLCSQEAILADEKRYLGGGRVKKLGKLHILDYQGDVVYRFELPEGGRFAAASEDGGTGIYISPGKVTILDLAGFNIQGQVEIPFQDGHVALIEES